MNGPSSTIVGRDRELRDISAFLDRRRAGRARSCSRGPPGIGKTTLWPAGVAEAASAATEYCRVAARSRRPGCRMRRSAISSERPRRLHRGMPTPLRQALDAALSEPMNPAARSIRGRVPRGRPRLSRASPRMRPMVFAVDDFQWLDRPRPACCRSRSARLGRAGRGARVDQVRADSPGDPSSSTGHAGDDPWASARCRRAARADPSRTNEPPTPPPRRGPGHLDREQRVAAGDPMEPGDVGVGESPARSVAKDPPSGSIGSGPTPRWVVRVMRPVEIHADRP